MNRLVSATSYGESIKAAIDKRDQDAFTEVVSNNRENINSSIDDVTYHYL
jgi:hypothetical protein